MRPGERRPHERIVVFEPREQVGGALLHGEEVVRHETPGEGSRGDVVFVRKPYVRLLERVHDLRVRPVVVRVERARPGVPPLALPDGYHAVYRVRRVEPVGSPRVRVAEVVPDDVRHVLRVVGGEPRRVDPLLVVGVLVLQRVHGVVEPAVLNPYNVRPEDALDVREVFVGEGHVRHGCAREGDHAVEEAGEVEPRGEGVLAARE